MKGSAAFAYLGIAATTVVVVGQIVLIILRARTADEPGQTDPLIQGTVLAASVIAMIVAANWLVQLRRTASLEARFPKSLVSVARKLEGFESDLWRIAGRHVAVPMFFATVIDERGLSIWSGLVAPREILLIPRSSFGRFTIAKVQDGIRRVDALSLALDPDAINRDVHFHFVGGGVGGFLPKRGSPQRELDKIRESVG